MRLLHETAREAINWGSRIVHDHLEDGPDDDALAQRTKVLVALSGRALLAFDEMAWLLAGGYPRGAWTRVRSIHELFIVALALGLYGGPDGEHPDLVERYVRHHDVFALSMADDLIGTGDPAIKEKLDDEIRMALSDKKRVLIEKYGKGFARPWGWAAPLLPKGPSFTGLNKLFLPQFGTFYGMASAHIHAGSQGLHDAWIESDEKQGLIMAGAEKRDLAAPAILGSGFLIGIIGTVVPTSVRAEGDGEPISDGRYFLGALSRVQAQVEKGMSR